MISKKTPENNSYLVVLLCFVRFYELARELASHGKDKESMRSWEKIFIVHSIKICNGIV